MPMCENVLFLGNKNSETIYVDSFIVIAKCLV